MTEPIEVNQDGETGETKLSVDQMLISMAGRLGLVETDEMKRTRERTIGLTDSAEVAKELRAYQDAVHQEIDKLDAKDRARLQIALIAASAAINFSADQMDSYLENIEDATDYAYNMGYDDLVGELEGYLPEES